MEEEEEEMKGIYGSDASVKSLYPKDAHSSIYTYTRAHIHTLTRKHVHIHTHTDYCDRSVGHIKAGDFEQGFRVWDEMLNGDLFPYPNYFHNITGSNDYDNVMNTDAPASFGYYYTFVNQPHVRKSLHVGSNVFQSGTECEKHLVSDFMASLAPQLGTRTDG